MNKLLTVASALVLAWPTRAFAAAESPANAHPEEAARIETPREDRFGNARKVAIGGRFPFSMNHYGTRIPGYSWSGASINPSLDYFVIDHLSVGERDMIAHSRWNEPYGEGSSHHDSSGPASRIRNTLWNSPSLWPTSGHFLFPRADRYDSAVCFRGPGGLWAGMVQAPLLAHVAKHFSFSEADRRSGRDLSLIGGPPNRVTSLGSCLPSAAGSDGVPPFEAAPSSRRRAALGIR